MDDIYIVVETGHDGLKIHGAFWNKNQALQIMEIEAYKKNNEQETSIEGSIEGSIEEEYFQLTFGSYRTIFEVSRSQIQK